MEDRRYQKGHSMYTDPELYEDESQLWDDYLNRRGEFADLDEDPDLVEDAA